MKLFNRGKGEDGAPPEAAPAPPGPPAAAPTAPGTPGASASEPAAEDAGAAPDIQVVLDNSLKDLNEKLSKLASSVEDVTDERSAFEEKIGKMEERMRKLAVLTEMVSSQYNPFLGDGSKPKDHTPPRDDEEASALPEPPALPPVDLPSTPEPGELQPFPEPPGLEPPAENPEPMGMPPTADPFKDEEAAAEPEPPEPAPAPKAGLPRAHLTDVENTFENHLLMMAWADALLKHTDRLAINNLLRYYEEIGWIGERVRKQLLGYTSGLRYEPVDPDADEANWRGNLELHEKSLLFIEKLRGHGVNQENLAALKRDIGRILGPRRREP